MSVRFAALAASIGLSMCAVQSTDLKARTYVAERKATYADVADLSFSAELIARVRIETMIGVDKARSSGVRPGYGRFYIEGEAKALLVSKRPLGRAVRYLVDLPVDAFGRTDNLEGDEVFIFARRVGGKPGQLQLVTPTAQLRWNAARATRLRGILRSAIAPDAPPAITGIRALLHVPGNLLGQGRTQIFLNTQDGSSASITVRHEPGVPPTWTASFTELIVDVGNPPAPDTLEWYRLACSLPMAPPPGANVSETRQSRWTALADYRLVLNSLGPCRRELHFMPQVTPQSYFATRDA